MFRKNKSKTLAFELYWTIVIKIEKIIQKMKNHKVRPGNILWDLKRF